jgi:hypothetical protein
MTAGENRYAACRIRRRIAAFMSATKRRYSAWRSASPSMRRGMDRDEDGKPLGAGFGAPAPGLRLGVAAQQCARGRGAGPPPATSLPRGAT